MTILRRINKLEELVKPLVDKIERKKAELKKREESFQVTNQIMQDFFLEHEWNKLSEEKKRHLEFSDTGSPLHEEVLILCIKYLRWLELYDKPGDQMEILWEQDKSQILKKVKSKMINQIAKS